MSPCPCGRGHCSSSCVLVGRDTPDSHREPFSVPYRKDLKMPRKTVVTILVAVNFVALLSVGTVAWLKFGPDEKAFAGQNEYSTDELKAFAIEHAHDALAAFFIERSGGVGETRAEQAAVDRFLGNIVVADAKDVTVLRSGATFTVKTWIQLTRDVQQDHVNVTLEYLGGDPADVDNWDSHVPVD